VHPNNQETNHTTQNQHSLWLHIVDDLLEISCALAHESRRFLCQALEKRSIQADSVDLHPGFSLQKIMVVISENQNIDECWFYNPKKKKITRLYPQKR